AQLDCHRSDRAGVDADRAFFAARADADLLVYIRRSHIDLAEWNRRERAGRAFVHALEAVADDAGHFFGSDERRAVSAPAGRVDLDAVGRADFDALAASAARFAE